ncbi:hypothetical protein WJX79_005908 [Trebouxia sp. C0005]
MSQSVTSESSRHGWSRTLGPESLASLVESSSHSVASNTSSRGSRSGLLRATSAPSSGDRVQHFAGPARHSEQPPGGYTQAPKQWVYKARLVDKWGFLAKTVLILQRLKHRPSDDVVVEADLEQHPGLQGSPCASLKAEQAVTPEPTAIVEVTHAAANAEAAAPAVAASDAAFNRAGEEELQSEGSASTAIKEATSSLLTDVDQDVILMSRGPVSNVRHDSQHAEQSSVLLEAEEDKVLYDVPTPFSGSSPDAMVIAAADTDGLTNGLIADTAAAGESLNEQQAGLPMALEVDTDRITDRLLTEESDFLMTKEVDSILDDMTTMADRTVPVGMGMDGSDRPDVSDRPEQLETESVLEGRVADAAEVPQYLPSSETKDTDYKAEAEADSALDHMLADVSDHAAAQQSQEGSEAADSTQEASIDSNLLVGDDSDQPTHTMHDEVVADNEADDAVDKAVDNAMDNAVDNAVDSAVDNAVDNAMDEMPINVSPPANPIVPLLSFEQQSADSAATAIAGGGASFGDENGMSSEVDGIIEQLMVAMSIGQTVGHSTPAAVAMQLVADVEATLTQLRDEADSDTQGPKEVGLHLPKDQQSSSAVSSSAQQQIAESPAQFDESQAGSAEAPAHSVGLHMLSTGADGAAGPERVTEGVDAVLADLSFSADQQMPQDQSVAASGNSTAAEPNYWSALAMLRPMEGAIDADVMNDRTAPASLAGNQQDQSTEDDGYGNEVFEADAAIVVETKSEDGLVEAAVAAMQEAQEEDARSEATSRVSSDLDAITEADAEAADEAAEEVPTPQAPAGPPPRHRSRQHAPLMHQTSQSGQGSLGQPARIEAFWPSPANSRPPSHASPHRTPPRAGSQGRKRHQKRAVGNSTMVGHRAAGDSLKADLDLEGSDMVDLQELGRPLKGPAGVVPETKSPAGLQLTRHLEYDILQCIAKDRPEHLSWLVVKAREMGVRPTNAAVAAATTICRLTRRQAVPKAPPLLTEELQGMRASLMGLDKIYHHHGIMPGAVRSSPVFDNASRALQRLTLDNEAAAAVATATWQAMEQVLEVARKQNNQVVAHKMEVALDRLEAEASGSPSARSVRSSRALEGAVRLRDLASPVRPRSMHGPRAPSPGRGQVSEDVVRRLEEHDDQQAAVHLAWLAQKDEQRRRHEAKAAMKKSRRLPQWYLHTAALRPRIDSQDFAAWRESHADALEEKTADQMSMMYIQTVEAELRKFRLEYMNRYNYARELNWQADHVHVKRQLFDDTLDKQPSNIVVSMPYATNPSRGYH